MTPLDQQLRSKFEMGWSVSQVRQAFAQIPCSLIADAYFAVRAAADLDFSPTLGDALSTAGAALGLSRAVVAVRALETLASNGLIERAAHGLRP